MSVGRFFAQTYAEARDKFFPAARPARPRRRDARPPPARPRRRAAGDGRGPRRARRRRPCWSSAAPATASRASAARACRARCSTTRHGTQPRARPAWRSLYVHALNPYGFSWWRRTTHENVDLNRNFRDFSAELPRNPAYDEIAALSCPRAGRPTRRPPPRWPRFVAERGARRCSRPSPAASTTIPTACSTAARRRPGAT